MRVRCALRRRVCTRFGFAVAARGGGRRIARLGPCQPVCALRASCGDHAAAGAAGRVPPCTSPAGPRVQVSRRGAVRNESRTRARVARGGPGACEPGHGAGGCASAPAPGVGGAGGGRCGEASFSYRSLFARLAPIPTDIHHTQSASGHRRTQPAVCRSGLGCGRYLPSICRQQVRPGAPRRHAIVYGPAVTRRASVRFSALGSARKDSRRTIIVKS